MNSGWSRVGSGWKCLTARLLAMLRYLDGRGDSSCGVVARRCMAFSSISARSEGSRRESDARSDYCQLCHGFLVCEYFESRLGCPERGMTGFVSPQYGLALDAR